MSSEAVYFSSRATVRFAIYPKGFAGTRVLAEISARALRDVVGAQDGGDSLVAAYRTHFAKIQLKALTLYCQEPGAPILLDSPDFKELGSLVEAPGTQQFNRSSP